MNEAHRLEQVAQEDREAAANLSFTRDGGGYCYLLLSGKVDDDPQIQAFARHRRAAISAYEATRQGEVEGRIASALGHLENIRAHGNAEANACVVIEAALKAALTPDTRLAELEQALREAIECIEHKQAYTPLTILEETTLHKLRRATLKGASRASAMETVR